jgi:hypothetical protein
VLDLSRPLPHDHASDQILFVFSGKVAEFLNISPIVRGNIAETAALQWVAVESKLRPKATTKGFPASLQKDTTITVIQ